MKIYFVFFLVIASKFLANVATKDSLMRETKVSRTADTGIMLYSLTRIQLHFLHSTYYIDLLHISVIYFIFQRNNLISTKTLRKEKGH